MVQHDNKPRRFAAYICITLSIAAALLSAVLCARLPFTAPADAEEISVSPAAEPELPPLPAPEEIPAPAPESAGPADGGRDSAAPEAGGEAAGIRPGDLMAGYIDGLIFIAPRQIPIKFDGEMGICQRPLRAQTAQGERVALASSESIPASSMAA